MDILIVTLSVATILVISYIFFSKQAEKQREREEKQNMLIRDFFQQEINQMGKLQLEGTGTDGNNDFEFREAVKKISLPNDARILIYD